jgi:hypothetical protein
MGCVALAGMSRQGRKGVLFRAIIGTCLNGAMLWIVCIGFALLIKEEPLAGLRQHSSSDLAKDGLVHAAGLEQALEKAGTEKSNSLSLIARPGAEFLREYLVVMTNYYVAAKPLEHTQLLDMAHVKTKSDLEARKTLLLQFIGANRRISNYYGRVENKFRAMVIKGGLSEAIAEDQSKMFRTNNPRILALWECNGQWAQGELQALGVLDSNWQSWYYDGSVRKTVFKDENVKAIYYSNVAVINAAAKKRTLLQQQLKQQLQPFQQKRSSLAN